MLSDEQYVEQSLINNLYYLRDIREFCTIIELTSLANNQNYIDRAEDLGKRCEAVGRIIVPFANGNLTPFSIESNIFVTEYTLSCEELTEKLFNVKIATDITKEELLFKPGVISNPSKELIKGMENVNRSSLEIVDDFIKLADEVHTAQKANTLFSYSYLAFYRYMLEEANFYKIILERIIARIRIDPTYVVESEYWSNVSMLDAASFIRGLTDPENEKLVVTANSFYNEFSFLLNEYRVTSLSPDNQLILTNKSYDVVKRFQVFVKSILDRLLNATAHFIAAPTFLDNIYRDVNYFIYVLTLNKVVVKP